MKKIFICIIPILIATMTMFMGGCTFFDDLFAPSDNEDGTINYRRSFNVLTMRTERE